MRRKKEAAASRKGDAADPGALLSVFDAANWIGERKAEQIFDDDAGDAAKRRLQSSGSQADAKPATSASTDEKSKRNFRITLKCRPDSDLF